MAGQLHAARISPKTMGATAIPHNTQLSRYYNNSSQCRCQIKILLSDIILLGRRNTNIQALVLIIIRVLVVIEITIVVIIMLDFGGGSWLRQFSYDLLTDRLGR